MASLNTDWSTRVSDKDQTQVSTATDAGDAGYNKALKNRHIQMIAIGGSIGTGLFLGAGGRLAQGGPALAFAYAVCGVFAFLMVRALGELAVRRPSSGAFVSYAREFLGEKGAFITGWFFFLDWAVTVMADITAVAALHALLEHVQGGPAVGHRPHRAGPRVRPQHAERQGLR